MDRLNLKDKARFPLPGTEGRFQHLGTAADDLGYQYLCFADLQTGKLYIEQLAMSGYNGDTKLDLIRIEDDALFHSLLQFFTNNGCIPISKPSNPWIRS